ncbi:MAG: MotA/TolQ/ExbB proton channel family protein [Waddliaceae bacterium]
MHWNIILILIGFCSLIAFTVFIERLIVLHRSEVDIDRLIIGLRSAVMEGNFVQSIQICEKAGGAVARMVKSGIERHHQARERIESAMEISGLVEIARLEKNAKILSVIAHICPLIGLLGTVVGFIEAFSEMRMSGLVDISASRIGAEMEYALVTTAAGLVVAIPSILGYNYLVSRIEAFVLEMQTTSSEIVDLLMHRDEF